LRRVRARDPSPEPGDGDRDPRPGLRGARPRDPDGSASGRPRAQRRGGPAAAEEDPRSALLLRALARHAPASEAAGVRRLHQVFADAGPRRDARGGPRGHAAPARGRRRLPAPRPVPAAEPEPRPGTRVPGTGAFRGAAGPRREDGLPLRGFRPARALELQGGRVLLRAHGPRAPLGRRRGRTIVTKTEPLRVIEADGGVNGYDPGLSEEELLHCYRSMLLVRAFDAICLKLQRAGRIGFSIPNEGVEATQIGAASALRKTDWIFPSYRDFGMALYHRVPPLEMMHNMFGDARDGAKGRQMPVHFSFVEPIHFVSISSPIGTHVPQAVGAAQAAKIRGEDTVVLASFGDGGTSSLGFHSGLNFAGVWRSPVVFLCQNNGWAISCPIEEQTASDGFAVKGEAYGMPGVVVDGNDVLAV